MYYIDANKHKWWYTFNPYDSTNYDMNDKYKGKKRVIKGLLDDHSVQSLRNKLIVTTALNPDSYPSRYFTFFNSFVEFYCYQQTLSENMRCSFEKIIGTFTLKPHFDIDISLKKYPFVDIEMYNEIIDDIIGAIDDSLVDKKVEIDFYKDVLMFTSHNSSKLSCHIVINHYVHSNNEEAKGFYHNVISRMNEDYAGD